jgi:hypothetical protein
VQGVEMREGSADDLQAGQSEKASTSSEKYKWDHAMEDLLCNLYEQYLEVWLCPHPWLKSEVTCPKLFFVHVAPLGVVKPFGY